MQMKKTTMRHYNLTIIILCSHLQGTLLDVLKKRKEKKKTVC